MKIMVTGTRRQTYHLRELECFLQETGAQYVDRGNLSLAHLQKKYDADVLVIWSETGPRLYYAGTEFFFHPSMGKNRIMFYRKKNISDNLITACDITPGDRVLDCTLGMGSDALVAAYFSETKVTALESSPLIAAVIRWGMHFYDTDLTWLKSAINNVEVVTAEHLTYLQQLPSRSFEVVYFDPMFRSPLTHSQPLSPLRALANADPLSTATIAEAQRVASKRVVLKELRHSDEFERLGFSQLYGSPNNQIAYGVIKTNDLKEQ